MPNQVVSGAVLACTFGAAPSSLTVPPGSRVSCGNMPAATVMDHLPVANVASFGLCLSLANPQVAAATAAAFGVLTPQPCVPATSSPWIAGAPGVAIGSQPALDDVSTCLCNWGGVISVIEPGQLQTQVP